MEIYSLIPEDFYRDFATKHNINGLMRNFFGQMASVEGINALHEQLREARDGFIQDYPTFIHNVTKSLVSTLPLILYRDTASSANSAYLRWRNVENTQSGQNAWEEIVSNPKYSRQVRESLVQIEKERLVMNLQVAALTKMMRQLAKCAEQMREIEAFFQKGNNH